MSNPTPKQAGWRVEMSTGHALEGGDLALCGSLAEWNEVLPLPPTLTLTPTPTLTLTPTPTLTLTLTLSRCCPARPSRGHHAQGAAGCLYPVLNRCNNS